MAHFIREEVLRAIVLNRIFAVTAMFYKDITAFMELIQQQRFDEGEQRELTPVIVKEFIKKIVVHAPEKIDGKRFQKVDIVFNFVGEIHLPTDPQSERKVTNEQGKTA